MNSRYLFPVVAVIIVAAAVYALTPNPSPEQVYCTQDAKLCPDGSSVGRVGPSCEFAPCPNGDTATESPTELHTQYISAHVWPPKITRTKRGYTCDPETSPSKSRSQRIVDDRIYCVEQQSGAAAGSVYIDYIYSTVKDGNHVTAEFTLRYPQCANYDEPKKTECEREREAFDLDSTIDRIIQAS